MTPGRMSRKGKYANRKAWVSHGHTVNGRKSPTFQSWENMLQRCTNPRCPGFKDYGARGITVCERWSKFENFLADMGERPIEKTLDRRNGAPIYSPETCQWADNDDQAKTNGRSQLIEFGGESLTISGWARRIGLSHTGFQNRLKRMSLADAISLPVNKDRQYRKWPAALVEQIRAEFVSVSAQSSNAHALSEKHGVPVATIWRMVKVRHPSMGGANLFRAQMRELIAHG